MNTSRPTPPKFGQIRHFRLNSTLANVRSTIREPPCSVESTIFGSPSSPPSSASAIGSRQAGDYCRQPTSSFSSAAMNDRLSAVFFLLLSLLASVSATLRPFGSKEGPPEPFSHAHSSLPPQVPTQYFLHNGRFGICTIRYL